jgi:hypothetical protein
MEVSGQYHTLVAFFFFFLGATARSGLWPAFFFRGFRNNNCFTGWGC